MIERTKEEIEAKLHELTDPECKYRHCKPEFEIQKIGQGWRIQIEQMFEFVEIPFAFLLALSEFFGTKHIHDARYSSSGCDTCNYGSSYYVVDLEVRED